LQDGVYTDLVPTPSDGPVTSSRAYQVNDAGTVVGYYADDSGQHAFIYKDGTYASYEQEGATAPSFYGINNAGTTTAQAMNDGGSYDSFYVKGNRVRPANVPATVDSYIHGLNFENTSIYSYTDSEGLFHGTINYRARGVLFAVDYPRAEQILPSSITSDNVIGGTAIFEDGSGISFVATPSSAPALSLPPSIFKSAGQSKLHHGSADLSLSGGHSNSPTTVRWKQEARDQTLSAPKGVAASIFAEAMPAMLFYVHVLPERNAAFDIRRRFLRLRIIPGCACVRHAIDCDIIVARFALPRAVTMLLALAKVFATQ
jgi:probable HAF family extracellular repeat protein